MIPQESRQRKRNRRKKPRNRAARPRKNELQVQSFFFKIDTNCHKFRDGLRTQKMPPRPVVLYGVPIPTALVKMWSTMQPFISWFQRVTAGYVSLPFFHVFCRCTLARALHARAERRRRANKRQRMHTRWQPANFLAGGSCAMWPARGRADVHAQTQAGSVSVSEK